MKNESFLLENEDKLNLYDGNSQTEENLNKSSEFERINNNLYSYRTDSGNKSITELLNSIFSVRLKILGEPIEEINEEIRLRKSLTKALNGEIDAKVKHLEFLLRDLDAWTMGYNDSIENRRIELQREILALEKEKRSEKLRFWEDVVSLINKRIDFLMEYQTLKSIIKII